MMVPGSEERRTTFWRRLFHRWFVEYNPLYLLSAALVLAGTILCARGLSHDGSVYGGLGVAAVAELYAGVLIGGAALLMRIGQRRSGVLLGLLTVVYQADVTLHTETCPNLGWAGAIGTLVWLAAFETKIATLAAALRIRPSRVMLATTRLGAVGLALFPYLLSRIDERTTTFLVGGWLLALSIGAERAHRTPAVTSVVALDPWAATVLRRTTRATWLVWGSLLGLHVLFWSTQYHLSRSALLLAAPVLVVPWLRSERQIWATVAGALALALVSPSSFSASAVMVASTLVFHGVRLAEAEACGHHRRYVVAALFALYLSAWTMRWTSGPWPSHVLAVDVLISLAVVLVAWRMRARLAYAPLTLVWTHFVVQARVVPAPHSLVEWGATCIASGFVLLVACLAAGYAFRANPESKE
ncbi:hypothetical protein AKJ09_04140 [Labilithrix luteola]|uniref:Uncharacterized protein n=1 Tax=Labilithrix luteola TaxID=1391654 RepID=A0A0K1PVR6_9BACT|nr:hypothetical protein [Labilithrix luteola]AKU97476.1 hypothetical protein AKJ09_04140 [Labilithrix luteola]